MSDKRGVASVDALPPDYQLRNFRLVRVLGRGGFGITYRAEDTKRGGAVAIKEFLPTVFAGRDGTTVRAFSESTKVEFDRFLQRFFDEATTLLRFGHLDNIVNVRGYFEANGTGYIVMDFETGPSLERLLTNLGRPTSEGETKAILLPLLGDLEEVHASGFLHRDIKPQNIIIRADGSPVLIDFGAARFAANETIEQTMTAFVSAGYTPWEQYSRDGHQGAWSDLYALGATAYRMITGSKPPDCLQRRLFQDRYVTAAQATTPGRYHLDFLAAIDWVLRLDPEQRPQSAAAWRAAFERGTGAGGAVRTSAPAPTPTPTPTPIPAPKLDSPKPPAVEHSDAALTETVVSVRRAVDEVTLPPTLSPTVPATEARSAMTGAVRQGVRALVGTWPQPLSVFRDLRLDGMDCPDFPEMVVIPKGAFVMGSSDREPERLAHEGPRHPVQIRADFAVGRFTVTFAEWDACLADGGGNGHRPSDAGWGRGRRPAINVSWHDAQSYVQWLRSKTGKPYRLLSEAEWEYAARAGSKTPFWWGSTITPRQANYDGSTAYNNGDRGLFRQKTVEVGSFRPNPFGLCEMAGNVWQWVEDSWHNDYTGAPNDGSAWVTGGSVTSRVVRGGCWYFVPSGLRSAYRFSGTADGRSGDIGFRVARDLSV